MSRPAFSVIVVGAGVGGLSLAVALCRADVEVTVLECRADPRAIENGGAFILWNNALKALRQLGLADEIIEAATTLERVEWRSPEGRCLARWPIAEIGHRIGEPALGVRRTALQVALAGGVGDGVLRLGSKCTGFREDADGVTVRLADGSALRADVVVGADGINSIVRSQLHDGWRPPRYAGVSQSFGICRVPAGATPAHTFAEFDGPGLRFFTFPVGGGETYWAAAARASQPARESAYAEPGHKDLLLERFRGWIEPVQTLIRATDEDAIYRRDIVDRRPITRWGRGRVTLLGDAAHPITPNLGQGACQAIEDSVVLAKTLLRLGGTPAVLRAYEADRIPRTNSFVRRSRMIGRVGRWRQPLACLVRDQATRVLVPGPALRKHTSDMAYEF